MEPRHEIQKGLQPQSATQHASYAGRRCSRYLCRYRHLCRYRRDGANPGYIPKTAIRTSVSKFVSWHRQLHGAVRLGQLPNFSGGPRPTGAVSIILADDGNGTLISLFRWLHIGVIEVELSAHKRRTEQSEHIPLHNRGPRLQISCIVRG